MVRALLLAALWVIAASVQAQVYKCIDAGGKTTYSQTPCPANSRSAAITHTVPEVPAGAPAGGASADGKAADGKAADGKAAKASGPKTAAELEQDFRKRKQEREAAQKKDAEKAADARVRDENCRNARQQVVTLESGVPQMRVDEQGNRIIPDQSQIDREKAFARKAVDQWCK